MYMYGRLCKIHNSHNFIVEIIFALRPTLHTVLGSPEGVFGVRRKVGWIAHQFNLQSGPQFQPKLEISATRNLVPIASLRPKHFGAKTMSHGIY